jgi:hypothetical protein
VLEGLRRLLAGVLSLPRFPSTRGRVPAPLSPPQLQLRLRLQQPIQGERQRPHRQSLAVGQRESSAGGVPQLRVEHGSRKRNGTGGSGVVGIGCLDPEPSGGKAAPPDPSAEALAHHPKNRIQNSQIIGVCGQGMGHVEL